MTGYGNKPFNKRHAGSHGIIKSNTCSGIENGRAYLGRQLSGRHFSACNCIDKLFFSALRVFGGQGYNLYIPVFLSIFRKKLDRVRLIVFHADITGFHAERFHQDPKTANDFFRPFQHSPVIGCQIGFAFRRVDDAIVDYLPARFQFHVGRKCCAAHADKAGFTGNF
ncbi:hypothetical protein SDC9_164720 [bioreactor metagenome]|uniref:Uncharacterized protein n=1 Tax=bioreactor metagenome TaxID=1076179 RepID=A0A645FSF3_9ZZZZ